MKIAAFLTRDELTAISNLAYMVKNSRQNVGVRMTDAAASVINILSEKKNLKAPCAELIGSFPAVLFFPTEKDRDEFEKLVKDAKPNFVSRPLE